MAQHATRLDLGEILGEDAATDTPGSTPPSRATIGAPKEPHHDFLRSPACRVSSSNASHESGRLLHGHRHSRGRNDTPTGT